MAAGAVDLPDGFVLDGQSGASSGMPDGFVLDKQPQAPEGLAPVQKAVLGARGFNDSLAETLGALPDLMSRGLDTVGLGVLTPQKDGATDRSFYTNKLKSGIAALGGHGKEDAKTGIDKFIYGAGHGTGDAAAVFIPATAVANTAKAGTMTSEIARALAAQPVTQAVSGAMGEGTTEGTGSPVAGLAASLLTAGGMGAGKSAIDYMSTENRAGRRIASALEADQKAGAPSLSDIADRLKDSPPGGMLVNETGENTKGLAGQVLRKPGPGRQFAIQELEAQGQEAPGAFAETVNAGTPGRQSAYRTTQALIEAQKTAADPLYDQAFKANLAVEDPEINRILNTPAGTQALKRAATTMQNDRTLVSAIDPEKTAALNEAVALGKADPVPGGVGTGLKLRTLDQVKQQLWDMGEAAKDQYGKNTADSRAIKGLYADLTNALDRVDVTAAAGPKSLKPEGGLYAQARRTFGGYAQSQRAVDLGQAFDKMQPEEFADELSKFSPDQRKLAQVGAADRLSNLIAQGKNVAGSVTKNNILKDQIRQAFGDASDAIINHAKTIAGRQADVQIIARGSPTAARLAQTLEDSKGYGDFGRAAFSLATGEYGNAALSGTNALLQRITGPSAKVSEAIAKTLFARDPVEQSRAIAALLAKRELPTMLMNPTRGPNAALLAKVLAEQSRYPALNLSQREVQQ